MDSFRSRNRKITPAQAREIRSKSAKGVWAKDLAAEYGLNVSTVYDICHGHTHPSRVTVSVSDGVMARLEEAATSANIRVEELSARLLAKSVAVD